MQNTHKLQRQSTDVILAGNLIGAADFLWSAAVLHVLSKSQCEKYVTSAQLLLRPGGTFYGWTVGSTESKEWALTPDGKQNRFLHSPVSSFECMLTALSNVWRLGVVNHNRNYHQCNSQNNNTDNGRTCVSAC